MVTRFRRTRLHAVAICTTSLLGACTGGDVDDAAARLDHYLRSRSDVATVQVRANNALLSRGTLDAVVTLRPELSDEQVAAAATEIGGHRVDSVQTRLRISYSARNADGTPATAGLYVVPGAQTPRLGDPGTYLEWVRRTRALVAGQPGVTAVDVWRDSVSATTTVDGYPLADAVDAYTSIAASGFTHQSVTGSTCVLEWDVGDRLAVLAGYRDVLAALPPGTSALHCRVTSARPATEPSLYVTVPRDTSPETVSAMQSRAARAGLAADITRGA